MRAQPDYLKLIKRLPLVPVRNDGHLKEAFKMLDELSIIDEERLSPGQADYLSVLSDLVERYESEHFIEASPFQSPVDVLRYVLKESGMSPSDLGRLLGNRQLGAALIRGDRQLSKSHIAKLCDHFRVSADLFLLRVVPSHTPHNHSRRSA